MLVIPALKRLRQEDHHEFEASLSYTAKKTKMVKIINRRHDYHTHFTDEETEAPGDYPIGAFFVYEQQERN